MSCSSKTDYFMTFQVTLLLKLCRLYQRKHLSQKCLGSTLWTAHLPKSNLKLRTSFSNILSELHMDISQTQDWAAQCASALHSAHHWCLTHSKVIWPKKAWMRQAYQKPDEPFLPQCPWKEMCLIQPTFSQYFIPEHVISVGKSFSEWTREARFCSHLHCLIISVDLSTTINSLQCTWCQSIPEGLSSQPKTWQNFQKPSASFHFPGNLFSNPFLR